MAAREIVDFDVPLRTDFFWAVRATVVVLRAGDDIVARWVVVRACVFGVFVVRAVTVRCVVVPRDTTVLFVPLREVVVVRGCVELVMRAFEFVVRTAASAKPMQVHSTTRKDSILFILCYIYNDNKKAYFGASGIYTKMNKKSRDYAGRILCMILFG